MNKISAVKRLRLLLKVDKKEISQVYIYAFFNGLVSLSLPLGIQAIVNLIQGGEVTTSWIILVAFVIGGVALTGVFQLLQLRIVENLSQKIFSRASFEFAYRIPKIKYSALYNYYAPELANRFFDTMTIQKGLPKLLIDFTMALFQIVVGLMLLSMYHTFFIVFSVIMVALIYVILYITGPRGLSSSISESSAKYKIAFWLEEIARTKLSFKLVGDSDFNLQKSNHYVDQYLTAREKHFSILVTQFIYLIGFKVLIAAGLLIIGSILVFNQEMNIGQFIAAEIIIIIIISSVEKLIKSLDSIYDVLTALEKIGYVTDLPLDIDGGLSFDENNQEKISVEATDLCYMYPDMETLTLDDVNFSLPAGRNAIISGASSSGKSTLLQIIAGILEPKSGVVKFRGLPMKSINRTHLRSKIGFSISQNGIFQGTILENISMNRPEATPQNISMALEMVGLDKFVAAQTYGLNTALDPEGKKIPRNVQNRLNLARAIVTKPKLLILEDPLDHIDPVEKEKIIKRITEEKLPWSTIVASYDPLWKKYIKDEIILQSGRVYSSTLKSQ